MKIVIHTTWGAFHIPAKMQEEFEMGRYDKIERTDARLVRWVEEHPHDSENLKVVEVPDDVKWHIHEYDGGDHVAEDHRTWH
jgi:hypothetical protein